MRILLDTNAIIWWLEGDPRLGAAATAIVTDPENEIFVSVASIWEIAIKCRTGKLSQPKCLEDALESDGISVLPILASHALRTTSLPDLHRDPFDRLLVAQAMVEQLFILTSDRILGAYGVPTIGTS